MTASPTQVNGVKRSAVPVLGPTWQIAAHDDNATVWEKKPAPTGPTLVETLVATPTVDPRSEAEAEAIRAQTAATVEAARIEAEAKADAILAKAEAEAERLRITNEQKRMALEEKQAAHAKRLAELKKEQEEIDRQAADARERADDESKVAAEERQKQQQAAAEVAKEQAAADTRWRRYALGFYIVCAVVALPVQIAAFWNPTAPWLVIAPLMLEGGAAVVLKGAAAAVASHRPHWHYRLIAWLLAFIAAGVNLWHGLNAFDPATAIGTAFASIAGPGVWDLHEHGRIRKRAGVLTRRERRAKQAEEKRAAAAKAAEKRFSAEREAYIEKAEREADAKLAADRQRDHPDELKYAVKLASAMGETSVTPAVWECAWDDLHAAKPGVTVDAIRRRNAAARRLEMARKEGSANTPSKVVDAQRSSHLSPSPTKPRTSPRPKPIPPRRTRGDSAPFHPIAKRAQAVDVRRRLATENASNADQN